MPKEPPIPNPEKMVHKNRSWVSTRSPKTFSKNPSAIGYTKVLTTVVRANFRPMTFQPMRSMVTLNISTKVATGIPKLLFNARPIPVVPPVSRPAGIRNSFTARAYSIFPSMTIISEPPFCKWSFQFSVFVSILFSPLLPVQYSGLSS